MGYIVGFKKWIYGIKWMYEGKVNLQVYIYT